MPGGRFLWIAIATWSAAFVLSDATGAQPSEPLPVNAHDGPRFQTSDNCLACHNGLMSPSGEDVSIGSAWRSSMMANAARDPYWQAAVRREVIDHPEVSEVIEDECSICHMPMSRMEARRAGGQGEIFAHLPIAAATSNDDHLAADGVSCTLCHQIGPEGLGLPESFTGGFVMGPVPPGSVPTMFGPYEVDEGRTALMRSATGVQPAEAAHIRSSEFCATCHTLITRAFGPGGEEVGRLPEQVPYLEWRHSAFRETQSCQACHMPAIEDPVPVSSVLGEPREGARRHTFLGGNFFIQRMLNRFRSELGVEAPSTELDAAAHATVRTLQTSTATVSISRARRIDTRLELDVDVRNLTGHKLPTGYPSRRTWLHMSVRDAAGRAVFESGAVSPSGAIEGNDNDTDPLRVEPHYEEISEPEQVQIYEVAMVDQNGAPTTGLLRGVSYVKDNRLLPDGFDKASAEDDIAVRGEAFTDVTFVGGGDRVRYVLSTAGARGPFEVNLELVYQPVAFRWAQNLRPYDAFETQRFVRFYDSMAGGSSIVLATTSARVP